MASQMVLTHDLQAMGELTYLIRCTGSQDIQRRLDKGEITPLQAYELLEARVWSDCK